MKRLFKEICKRAGLTVWAALATCLGAAVAPAGLQAQINFTSAQAQLPVGSGAEAEAVDQAGNLYLAYVSNQITRVDPSGNQSTITLAPITWSDGTIAPIGGVVTLATDAAGNLYVLAENTVDRDRALIIVAPDGTQTISPVPTSILGTYVGFAGVDGQGNSYFFNETGTSVVEYSPSGAYVTAITGGFPLHDDAGATVDAAGDVYFGTERTGLYVIRAGQTVPTQLPVGGAFDPYMYAAVNDFAATDAKGNVYFRGGPSVYVLTPGGAIYPVATGFGGGAFQINSDPRGNLFVLGTDGSVTYVQLNGVDFGSVNMCPQATAAGCSQTLTLNYYAPNGGGSLNLQALTTGQPGLDFAAASTVTSMTPQVSFPGLIYQANVSFTPQAAGARNGAAQLVDASGNLYSTTLIHGTGVGPQIAYGPGVQTPVGGTLQQLSGLATDAAGDLFITDSDASEVYKITPGGVQTSVASIPQAAGIAVDGAGNLFIGQFVNGGTTALVEVTPSGAQTTLMSLGGIPTAVATDGSGDVFVAARFADSVQEWTPSGAIKNIGSGLENATAVAIDASGNVFVGDSVNHVVIEVTPAGVQSTVMSNIESPYAMAFDASGNLYIADAATSAIWQVTPGGVQTVVANGFSSVASMALDSSGDIFVGTVSNIIELQRSQPPSLSFASTSIGTTSSDSPQSVEIENVGNAALNLTNLSVSGNFAQVDGSGTPADCTASDSLAAGTACDLSLSFTPESTGTNGGSVVLTDNTLNVNPAMQTIQLNGVGTLETQTIEFGSELPGTVAYGSPLGYGLYGQSTSGLPVSYTVSGPGTINNNILTFTGVGTVVVTASQAGNADYSAATPVSVTVIVTAASQTITFTGLPATATYGSAGPYTLGATASSRLPVSYMVSGPATINGTTLTLTGPGTVVVTASQAGNTDYQPATAVSESIVVSAPAPTYDTAISVKYASTRLVYPGATNITVCIASATRASATGTVRIFDGSVLLATLPVQGGGCAYWYIAPGLEAGQHSLTAVYSGDRNNPGGTSAPTILNVAPVPVNMAPACWLTNSGYGANYQCTVSLSSDAGAVRGVMTYSLDGAAAVSVPVNNGTADFTLPRPDAGKHTVVLAYAQQTNYAAAGPVTENFTVAPAAVYLTLTPSSWYTSASGGISFVATVNSSSAGAPNSNGSIEFFDGGNLLATAPVNATGQARYSTTSLAPGSHTITATYSGGANYASGSTSVTITLTK